MVAITSLSASPFRPVVPRRGAAFRGLLAALALCATFAVAAPSFAAAGFRTAAKMSTGRYFQTSTLLADGRVLVVGGGDGAKYLDTAEIFDPRANAWHTVASLPTPRAYHSATLLPSGKVLVVGGFNNITGNQLDAQLYDPGSDTWSPAGTTASPHLEHTATMLASGKVLVAGGFDTGPAQDSVAAVEIYDPLSNGWTAAAPMATPRSVHSAVLLGDGSVLVSGGRFGKPNVGFTYLDTAERYDPQADAWTPAGTLLNGLAYHSMTLLPDGRVLLAGGVNSSSELRTVQVYDPAANAWTEVAPMGTFRHAHTATLLPSGKVAVVGGFGGIVGNAQSQSSAETYDPASDAWTPEPYSMAIRRDSHTATLLADGQVLIAGGYDNSPDPDYGLPAATEILDASAAFWNVAGPLATPRFMHTATLLRNGDVLVAGGTSNGGGDIGAVERYSAQTNSWSATGALNTPRYLNTATLLLSGDVLVTGGFNGGYANDSAERYSPKTGTWTLLPAPMAAQRVYHTATLLPDGKVMLIGGVNGGGFLKSTERFDPRTGTFAASASMAAARIGHSATLLASGKLLVVGGFDGSNLVGAAQLYDPATNSWTPAGTLGTPRRDHSASLLPSGRVLIAGGTDANGPLDSAEVYDPATNTFAPTGALPSPRNYHTAVVLATGEVLLLGGESPNGPLAEAARYDAIAGQFSSEPVFNGARYYATATLLPSGRVLLAGGRDGNGAAIAAAALYDRGLGAAFARRPVVLQLGAAPRINEPLRLIGDGFNGDSEAASASNNSSPTNYPLVNLRRVDGDDSYWLQPDADSLRSPNLFVSDRIGGLPFGQYALTVIVNGIPSKACMISIRESVPDDSVFREGFESDLGCN